MQTFTSKALLKTKISRTVLIALAFTLTSFLAQSQVRSYNLIYSENLKGNTTLFGNTLMNIVFTSGSNRGKVDLTKMNGNSTNGNSSYGNNNSDMQFVDIDNGTLFGKVIKNSSSADLVLPAGVNTIKFARLYWGGNIKNSEYNLSSVANQTVKIRKGASGNYVSVVASSIDKLANSAVSGYTEYQAYADITAFIKQNGAGTYSVGSVPLSVGSLTAGAHGGWCIVIVYENATLDYTSVRVYDGFQEMYGGESSNDAITANAVLTGLNVPSGTLAAADAKMGVMCWEGDADRTNDFLKINGHLFSNSTNASSNPWNGTITDNGVHVTTKNPNYTNQMGLDIDMFNVGTGYGIVPNANSVSLQFGTTGDQYYPGLFTFSIKMKDPTITLQKLVTDESRNNLAEKDEILTYTLKGTNTGVGNANGILVTDTLPNTVTYVPNSLKVISSPGITPGSKTDAKDADVAEFISTGSFKTVVFRIGTGATGTAGGTLASSESYEVQFEVKVNDPGQANRVPSIMNIARVKASSDALEAFTDEGTVIINPEEGPLPVTLSRFTASLLQENKVQLDWGTSMEINCSRFVVERSNDANSFSAVATVAGNGTTSLYHNYSALDDISSVTGNTVYYRLRQIDIDGKAHFSNVIALKIKKSNQLVTVSPNPFTSYINVNMNWDESEEISARIINLQGKIVASKTVQVNKGSNYVRIDNLSNLPSGNYILQLVSPNGKIIQKIMK